MRRKILPKQKKGRTPRENGDVTLAKIIEAAGELFAERGYAETTNQDIAKRAKVSITSINYHFGSREVLYEAVIQRVNECILEPEFFQRLEGSTAPYWERLTIFIDYITNYVEGGWELKMWARETVAPSSLWLRMTDEFNAPKIKIILGVLSKATGIPMDAPELEICLLTILSPAVFMLIANPKNQKIGMPAEQHDASMVSESIKEFILAGVERTIKNYKKRQSL